MSFDSRPRADELEARAREAEALAARISYAPDRQRLLSSAKQWRALAQKARAGPTRTG